MYGRRGPGQSPGKIKQSDWGVTKNYESKGIGIGMNKYEFKV